MSNSNCCFLTCIQIFQEVGHVVWYSHLFKNFPQFAVIHTVKGFGIVNKTELDVLGALYTLTLYSSFSLVSAGAPLEPKPANSQEAREPTDTVPTG